MYNANFDLDDDSYLGFGTLNNIDSYILENRENLTIKYNVYIEDEEGNIKSFYHKGGKPAKYICDSINKKMFFIVNKNNEIEYITDLITNKKINDIIKDWSFKNQPDFDTIKIIMLMIMFTIFLMADILFLKNDISTKQLIINISLSMLPVLSYSCIKIIEFKQRRIIRKESERLKKEIKEWNNKKIVKNKVLITI